MPTNLQELFLTRDEAGTRLGGLEIRDDAWQIHDTVSENMAILRSEFDEFKASMIRDFNALVDKLRSCAKANDLVDEYGGSLDEFLESFRRN